MKPAGRHPVNKLTALKVQRERSPGRYCDGNGLYLIVDPSGAKRWVLRTIVQGKRCDIGLGGTSTVTLSEARERAVALRKTAKEGGDPIADRRVQARVIPTFAEAARSIHTELTQGWKNDKHKQQWINTLTTYAFPLLGDMKVDEIETSHVLQVLSPIWLEKKETASRVRQRIHTILDWAKAAGHRQGDNPVDGVNRGLPRQTAAKNHFAALPYTEVSSFITALHSTDSNEITRLAFEFLILTATRTSETLFASVNEVDFENRCWIIPAERMKAKQIHRVPLSDRCIQILHRARAINSEGDYFFPGRSGQLPLSNMTFTLILRRMEVDATAHGFRSAFRDWAAEETNYTNEVAEMALAHTIKDKTEAAYRRGDLFERRRLLMQDWANYACPLVNQPHSA